MKAATAISQTLPRRHVNWRVRALVIVAALLAVFVGANAHLVYVAIQSQPDCVMRTGAESAGGLRPAKPSC
jgi:hypothetical protein